MKHSIKNIFKSLKTYLFFILFVTFLALMLVLEQQLSFDKIETLNNNKTIIKKLVESHEKDIELALIQSNAQSTKLLQNIEKLKTLYKYNIFEELILKNSIEYTKDLNKLDILIQKFNATIHKYYIQKRDTKLKNNTKEEYLHIVKVLEEHINTMLLKTLKYNEEKFELIKYFIFISFILIFIATFWYKKILNFIYEDINYLFQLNREKDDYNIYSIEADAIALRMNRKNQIQDNYEHIDILTDINNYKGLLYRYAHKKSIKTSNFTSVTLLEIDNFSKSECPFSKETAEAMLKKVAYIMKLHKQPVDIIARTDYNQFAIVLSRPTKEQTFKEVDLIRENIAELKFNIPNHGATQITVSGGFIIKSNNISIEESLKQANKILTYAKSVGKNKILQLRDLT